MSSSSSSFSALTPGNKFTVLGEQLHENDVASEPTKGPAKPPKSKWDKFKDDDLTDCELPEDKGKVPVSEAGAAKAKPRSYILVTEEIPSNLQYKEFDGNTDVYPEEFAGYQVSDIHKGYRGKDAADFGKFITRRQHAQVMFPDEKLEGGRRVCKGLLPEKHSPEEKFIRVSFRADTQMPVIKLHIAKPDGGEVTYHVFANCIAPAMVQDDEITPAGASMDVCLDQMNDLELRKFTKNVAHGEVNLGHWAKIRNLMVVSLELYQPGSQEDTYRCRPFFSGITDNELTDIRTKFRGDLTDFEQTIRLLDSANNLRIFRRLNCSDMAALRRFNNVFFGSMHLCSAFRNFWYYQFQYERPAIHERPQPENDIFKDKCNLEHAVAPRWMITKWLCHSDGYNTPVKTVEQLAWTFFTKSHVFPSVEDCAFLLRLALARERNSQVNLIKGMENSTRDGCNAMFEAIEGLEGVYIAKLALPAVKGRSAELVKPALDTRVKIRFNPPGSQSFTFSGQIIEAPGSDDVEQDQNRDWDVAARVEGQQFAFEAGVPEEVRLEFIDDKTPSNRACIATESMAMIPLKRREGVDIPSIIFRTKPTVPFENQNTSFMSETSIIELGRRGKAIWKLNVPQKEAVNQSFNSPTGLTLVYGPPGTGKTTTTTVAAYEHCRTGHKVIYTCTSNKATDTALSSFLKNMQRAESSTAAKATNQGESSKAPVPRKIVAVRFVGGLKVWEFATMDTEKAWEGVTTPTILAASNANPDTLFHIQLGKAIRRWADALEHKMKTTAREYQATVKSIKENKRARRYETRKNLVVLEEQLVKHFVENEVDIVFTTCSSAANPTIQTSFKPDVAFIDEAGQATIADTCMALDPFKESIKWLIMSGDYNQLMPVVTAKTANEGLQILEESLFSQLFTDPDERFPRIMLNPQYRQHEDLAAWPNEMFYEGKLDTHASASQGTPLQKTLKQFFSNLGGAMRHAGSIRVAVDVSNQNAVSEKYLSTASYCNNEEARVLVGLIEKLLAYNPICDKKDNNKFAKVSPSDIGIITPFKGQQRLIRNYLKASSIDPVQVNALVESTHTTWGMPGDEVNIAFISLCCRVPENAMAKMRFVATPNALCVQNTRAREFQITLGNLRGWCEAVAQPGRTNEIRKNLYDAFRSLVEDMYNKNDIVSSSDVESALLSEPSEAQRPTKSQFYTQVPTIKLASSGAGAKRKGSSNASQHHQEVRGEKKPKTAFDMRGLQDEMATAAKPLSKKERQQAVKAARRAEREEAAAAAAATTEGAAGPSIEKHAFEPTGDLGL
jgi:DNA polymerase III delta prime subunit